MNDKTKRVKNKKNSKVESNKQLLKEKDAIIEDLNSSIELLKDKNVKLLAEFDNFQRRSFSEKEAIKKYQGINLLKDLLPAFDDINRAVIHKDANEKSIFKALELINSKIKKILKKHSIVQLDSVGIDFDPTLHEALMEQNSDEVQEGKVIEEYESAYKYHDRVIRHAKVVVSKGKS